MMLSNKGIPPIKVLRGDYTYESGYEATTEIMKGDKPDIIVCSGDNMAFGVMDALRHKFGMDIPKDISVVGFDDNPVSKLKSYDLTTIHQPIDEMITATIEVANSLLDDPSNQRLLAFETQLILRGSTRKQ